MISDKKHGMRYAKTSVKSFPTRITLISLLALFLLSVPVYSNLRIMSYNIKDFWLRFDGEPDTIANKGADLDRDDLKKLEVIAAVINEKKPDVIGILECASLAELFFFNERFLKGEYKCWSFRAYDSRTFGIPLGIMVKKDLQVKSVDLVEPKSFSSRGIIVADISKSDYEFTLVLVHLKSKIEDKLGESALKRDKHNQQKEIGRIKLSDNQGLVATLVDNEKLDLRIFVKTDSYTGATKRGFRLCLSDSNWTEFKELINKIDKAYKEIA